MNHILNLLRLIAIKLQSTYLFMQTLPEVSLKAAVHRPLLRSRHPKGLWLTRVCHPTWVLDYCGWEGMQCRLERGGKAEEPFPWLPGTWHLYAPRVPYRLRFDRPELYVEDLWLRFEWRRPPPALAKLEFAVIADAEEHLASDVRALCDLQERGLPGSELTIRGHLLCVLGKILTAAQAGARGTRKDPWRVLAPESLEAATRERLLHQVDMRVGQALDAPPNLPRLAALLNMSVSSLAHRFKRETGMTVAQRVRWLRIREARRLLAKPSATVKSVAQALGFRNPFHFSRVFAQVAGLPPTSYLGRYKDSGR